MKRLPIEVVPDEELKTGDRPLVYVGGDGPIVVRGSEQLPCGKCKEPAWFSPASLSIIRSTTRPIVLSCFRCWVNEGSN